MGHKVSQLQEFLQGKRSFSVTYRELGFVQFVISILKTSKIFLLRRLVSAVYAKAYTLYKKHRYDILLPYLKFRDKIDVVFFLRKLLPLHRRLEKHLAAQKKAWKSHIYTGGYYYQGWDDIGIRGIRETNQRFADYGLASLLSAKMNVLDIGCNNGFLALKVAQFSGHVDAIEFNPFLVAIGRDVQGFLGIENIDFIVGDFAQFNPGKRYDLIMSLANHQTGDANLNLAFRNHMERLYALLNDEGLVVLESHISEARDPEFLVQIKELDDLFSVVRESTISQYKIIYIGDRLLFVLRKKKQN